MGVVVYIYIWVWSCICNDDIVVLLLIVCVCLSIDGVYRAGWLSCPDIWKNSLLAEDFTKLKEVRDVVMKSLQLARSDNLIRSSLEAEVYILTQNKEIHSLLNNHFSVQSQSSCYTLADYLVVSRVHVTENELPATVGFKETVNICHNGNNSSPLTVGVVRASGGKCERCWQYITLPGSALCQRCLYVVNGSE